jgi:hypothetical protein
MPDDGWYDEWGGWHPSHPKNLGNSAPHDPIPVHAPRLRVVREPEPTSATADLGEPRYIPDPEPWTPPELPRTYQWAKPERSVDLVEGVRLLAAFMRDALRAQGNEDPEEPEE